MKIYSVFDVDGTITPTRSSMEEDFIPKFAEYCKHNNVVIVSGSTKEMIQEQIPENILSMTKLYTCSGVEGCSIPIDYEIEDIDNLVYRLKYYLKQSGFPNKAGRHIDIRKGMVNFSIPGRDATIEQRKQFVEYNNLAKEAEFFRDELEIDFPQLQFCIGGETSIDITNIGINKSLVAKDLLTFEPEAYIIFYGNQILGGNDYPLAKYIDDSRCGHSIQINYPDLKKLF